MILSYDKSYKGASINNKNVCANVFQNWEIFIGKK